MATSTEIKQRANTLADKTDVNSITPKEVGGIMYDLASHGENVLRNGGTLGIRKVYESVAAMEADSKNPKDFWGDPIKKGNLVVIYDGTTTGVDNNKIYAFMKPGWQIATHLDAGYATKAGLDAAIENVLDSLRNSENALNESIDSLEETVTGNKKEVDEKLAELGSKVNVSEIGNTVPLYRFVGWEFGSVYLSGAKIMYADANSVIRTKEGVSLILPSCRLILGDNLTARIIKVLSDGYETLYNYPDSKSLSLDEGEYIFAITTVSGIEITDLDTIISSCRFESKIFNDIKDNIADIDGNIADIESNIADIDGNIADIESNITDAKIIDVTKLDSRPCSMARATWYAAGSHKSIPIGSNKASIVIETDITANIAFVTTDYNGSPIGGDDVPYVSGTGRIDIEANTETTLNIPSGTAYIILTEKDGGGNYPHYKICKLVYGNNLYTDVKEVKSTVQKFNIAEFGGKVSLSRFVGWELGTVYLSGSRLAYSDSTLVIRTKQGVSLILPPCNLILGDNLKARVIKVADGVYETLYNYPDSKTLSLEEGEYIFAIATIDLSEITDVPNIISKCRFESKILTDITNAKNFTQSISQTKGLFSIMSYNIGGWYNGSGLPIPLEEENAYLPIQRQIINRYHPDFALFQEYLQDVVQGELVSSELLPGYNIESVQEIGYLGKAIASVSKMVDFEDVTYENQGDGIPRHYFKGYAYCNGRRICFVSTHLTLVKEYAVLQIEELIDAVKNEEYVVIGMDSNIDVLTDFGKSAFNKFTDAGLTYLNKDIVTYPNTSIAIDNIIVSNNITCKSIYADTSKSVLGTNADHYPLLAYLEIY